MQKFLLDDIWPTIKALSGSAKRVQAAIAYFSSTGHIKFRKGDMLVVDASEGAITAGQTSARLLWDIHKKVQLYSLENLHAKLVIVDDTAVIGSANASASSINSLYEAALMTDSPSIVSQARSYLHQLAKLGQPLDEAALKRLLKIKVRTPRFGSAKPRKQIHAHGRNTWIFAAEDIPDGAYQDENRFIQSADKKILKLHPKAESSWLRLTGSSNFRANAQNGDQIIIMRSEEGKTIPYEVLPPSSILFTQPEHKWTRFYYDDALSYPRRKITWKEFKTLLKEAGMRRNVTPRSVIQMREVDARHLENLWPRQKKKRS
ncbi:MAG: phospholipase D family protein [Limisphaerales bacterium]